MKEQVLSIPQMQELIDIGVDVSKASCCWCKVQAPNREGFNWVILPEHLNKCDTEHTPTFTLQDILDMLPKYIKVGEYEYKWNIMPLLDQYVFQYLDIYDRIGSALITFTEDDVMVGAYNLLKWCKENNFI